MFQNVRLSRGVLPLLVCAALVAGCEKHDTPPADAARQSADALRQAAQDAAQRATQQATQKLDQAASFVNQQVDAARAGAQRHLDNAASQPAGASAAELASAAKGQWRDAASSANALLGHAAATTGTGLQAAGRALQQWASGTAAASAPAASGNGE
ncbi:hypothetical protein [Paraburkholderia caballeronis]|uniref:Lipoprotein n=1 Tax=Paraburkholderia caballeronis TaxID=416943 RepID=A0A1H7K436_9BURK|nr:hypothetical protein [Paraburkholderia caballeronis]PXW27129.1 hypothetical protein C7403_10334 [Paraburkholderia caballeronis]PXX02603.1 hypothetical protein C7407_10334 [Paraburkholderia caballeronis]RAK03328.1 hypothetical protein C7409_10334 [Paraburkholderia caballeronis]TDV11614.1 hypothetical protein C7406_12090 [Paraburkholderia caballeronis]TDV17379.1 hypothetical protein C7408_10432 [Paraburkholderia caballeronis]